MTAANDRAADAILPFISGYSPLEDELTRGPYRQPDVKSSNKIGLPVLTQVSGLPVCKMAMDPEAGIYDFPGGRIVRIGTTVASRHKTFEVSVLMAGVPQILFQRPSDQAIFVAGVPGRAYTLRIRNLSWGRIEVVNTVDGRNTLKDEPGDARNNRGLVFYGGQTGEFTGWRTNDNETREFIFGNPEHSVAAQATGSAANVGIIGFAAYTEKVPPPVYEAPVYRSYPGGQSFNYMGGGPVATASAGGPEPMTRGLGTGIGETRNDAIGRTDFIRIGAPEILTVGYDTEQALAIMGVGIAYSEPDAFPGMGTGYEHYSRPF